MFLTRAFDNGLLAPRIRTAGRNGRVASTCVPTRKLLGVPTRRGDRLTAAFKKNEGWSSTSSSSKFGLEREGESWTVYLGQKSYNVSDKTLWSVGAPGAIALGGMALVFGPVLIAITIATTAITFAFSIGAFAITTFVFPLLALGLGAAAIGSMAFAGLGLFIPLAVAGGVALAGGLGLSIFSKALPKAKESASKTAGQSGPTVNVQPESEDPHEAEIKKASQELRDFDDMLADREQKRRMECQAFTEEN